MTVNVTQDARVVVAQENLPIWGIDSSFQSFIETKDRYTGHLNLLDGKIVSIFGANVVHISPVTRPPHAALHS
jgi:hypothetical protein